MATPTKSEHPNATLLEMPCLPPLHYLPETLFSTVNVRMPGPISWHSPFGIRTTATEAGGISTFSMKTPDRLDHSTASLPVGVTVCPRAHSRPHSVFGSITIRDHPETSGSDSSDVPGRRMQIPRALRSPTSFFLSCRHAPFAMSRNVSIRRKSRNLRLVNSSENCILKIGGYESAAWIIDFQWRRRGRRRHFLAGERPPVIRPDFGKRRNELRPSCATHDGGGAVATIPPR